LSNKFNIKNLSLDINLKGLEFQAFCDIQKSLLLIFVDNNFIGIIFQNKYLKMFLFISSISTVVIGN